MRKVININNGIARMPKWRMKKPVHFDLLDNEHIAIVGNNGSGKSIFVDMIVGRYPLLSEKSITYDFSPHEKEFVSDNIKYIRYHDCYGGDTDKNYFLQQRWNQAEIDESTVTVEKRLEQIYMRSGSNTPERQQWRKRIQEIFMLDSIADKYIISLSSGELRRLSLAEALFSIPNILIIDNPFIGLDAETRDMLNALLSELACSNIVQFILVLNRVEDIPSFITHVVEVKDMTVMPKVSFREYPKYHNPPKTFMLGEGQRQAILSLDYKQEMKKSKEVVRMNNVTICYGGKTILKDINWTVLCGERWALTGHNGSGKSTLLSIIYADNPQSYACDVTLFDKKRGTGESIWDIKKRIGYMSPEMHRAMRFRNLATLNIIVGGLNNSFGICQRQTKSQLETCLSWMEIFGISHLSESSFHHLSSGEQRLVLLARAFVNDPELLILDEPLHGLDATNKAMVNAIVETFCQRSGKTLIYVTHYKDELPPCIDHELHLIKQ